MSGPSTAEAVLRAFAEMAQYCTKLGSPFTAAICETLADVLDEQDAAGRRILGWPGDPSPLKDNLPLRVAGALNALAASGRFAELSAAYPPRPTPPRDALATLIRRALREHGSEIVDFLRFAPQTNEVGRSAVLIGGLLEIAARTALPLSLYEIGSSAGLNLVADKYRYRLDGRDFGPPDARLRLEPAWTGPAPRVDADLVVVARQGCDQSPIDVADAEARRRLRSYVWPDQPKRLERLNAAIETVMESPPVITQADAADWVETRLPAQPVEGLVRVLFHSIVWSYLPAAAQARIEAHLARAGAASLPDAPLAWLRYELTPGATELRLTLWPDGPDQRLADAHPHGHWVRWAG